MSNQLAIRDVENTLESLIHANKAAIPENFNTTRFIQNCMAVLPEIKDIEKVEPPSIARTLVKAAYLGLDFFNKECYAIVYGKNLGTKEKPNWVKELQFQTDYKGEIKLAKKYSYRPIKDVYAKLVREGDSFEEVIYHGKPSINFQPKPFNNGKIIGAFAVCLYQDGSMIYETMSAEEIDKVRTTYSKMPDGKAWKESNGEMAKKTVIRRLRKQIQLEFDNPQQIKAFEDGGDAQFVEEVEPEPIKMPEPIQETEKKQSSPKIPTEGAETGRTSTQSTNKNNGKVITDPQKKRMFAISNKSGVDKETAKAVLSVFGYESSSDVLKSDYDKIINVFSVPSITLAAELENRRKAKWAAVDADLGKSVDEWLAEEKKLQSPDELENIEQVGRKLLAELEKLESPGKPE